MDEQDRQIIFEHIVVMFVGVHTQITLFIDGGLIIGKGWKRVDALW